jgi:hypothetical protein
LWQGLDNTDDIVAMYDEYKAPSIGPEVGYHPEHLVPVELVETISGVK